MGRIKRASHHWGCVDFLAVDHGWSISSVPPQVFEGRHLRGAGIVVEVIEERNGV
jgi:hypothetical protein